MGEVAKISGLIIAYNEAANIVRCIKSLQGICDEVIVVDSFSTDNTKALSLEAGATVIENAFGGHIEQKNFAISQAKYAAVLSLDADEALSEELQKSILAVKQNHKTFVRVAIPMLFSEKNRAIFTSEIKEITNEALKITPQGIIAALEGMKIREDNTSIYKSANFPIQLIIGKQDPALDYESLINQTKNTKVQVVEFPDGHMSHIENKDELIATLTAFVKYCT